VKLAGRVVTRGTRVARVWWHVGGTMIVIAIGEVGCAPGVDVQEAQL